MSSRRGGLSPTLIRSSTASPSARESVPSQRPREVALIRSRLSRSIDRRLIRMVIDWLLSPSPMVRKSAVGSATTSDCGAPKAWQRWRMVSSER